MHETEYKKDDLNPDFAPFTVSGDKLCRCNEDVPLKLELWDYSKDGEDSMKRIGKGYFTVIQLASGAVKEIATLDESKKPSGTIIIEKFQRDRTYDLIDYMNGGLSLNMVVMIDFTNSNGNPKDRQSFHFFDKSS